MAGGSESSAALIKFEQDFHEPIHKWIQAKMEPKERNEILDISADLGIFSFVIAEKVKAEKLVSAFRNPNDEPSIKFANFAKFQISVKNGEYEALQALGKFDTIIIKEILHECDDLSTFFHALQSNLREPIKSKIFIWTRPKNPPLPLPDPALEKWRKYAPTREEIVEALTKVCEKEVHIWNSSFQQYAFFLIKLLVEVFGILEKKY